MQTTTRVHLTRHGEDTRLTLEGDVLRPVVQRLGPRPRIALVATQMLLLGGDGVLVEVILGPGVHADLVDVAAVVCHRGDPSTWQIDIVLSEDSHLTWAAAPCIVTDGADVRRHVQIDAAGTARLSLRDTLVLGRSGERGGRVCSDTGVRIGGTDVLVERQLLDADRHLPGILGPHRVIDTLLTLGGPPTQQPPGVLDTPFPDSPVLDSPFLDSPFPDSPVLDTPYLDTPLLDDRGRLYRWLGSEAADSPLPLLSGTSPEACPECFSPGSSR